MNGKTAVHGVLPVLIACLGFSTLCMVAEGEQALNPPLGIGTGKVLGIHHYSLRTGVDPAGFEHFVTEEYLPTFKTVYADIQFNVMKGDRGKNIGQYILVVEIPSLSVRTHYWPSPDVQSEAARNALAKCGARCTELNDRFLKMVERTEFTDYVALAKK